MIRPLSRSCRKIETSTYGDPSIDPCLDAADRRAYGGDNRRSVPSPIGTICPLQPFSTPSNLTVLNSWKRILAPHRYAPPLTARRIACHLLIASSRAGS